MAAEAARRGLARLSNRLEESYRLRRLRGRLGPGAPARRAVPPERPVGIKLELTHACNLRCDFCYTDSPRHTLARTADLPDQRWREVVDQALALGVVEAVITGGEPLLQAQLTLELVGTLAAHGVGVTLNTNGWFVNDAIADQLAAVPGLTVNVSLDGATPELHDAARGVPGSWRRAVQAISRLLERDVRVVVVVVVTPLNARWIAELLEHLWLLGVRGVRLTPVVPVGAASRRSGWTIDRRALRSVVAQAAAKLGTDFRPVVQSGVPPLIPNRADGAPAALLVRPGGVVMTDTLHPFAFGHVDDGLTACWQQVRAGWGAPEMTAWARGVTSARALGKAEVVPYVDPEPLLAAESASAKRRRRSSRPDAAPLPPLPRRRADSTRAASGPGGLPAARRAVLELFLGRRYQAAPLRWSGDGQGERVVRLTKTGRMCRLNANAGLVLEWLEDQTVGEVAAALAQRHPEVELERVMLDTVRTVRWLAARGIVRPVAPARATQTAQTAQTAGPARPAG